jgi:Response regulator receiver domain
LLAGRVGSFTGLIRHPDRRRQPTCGSRLTRLPPPVSRTFSHDLGVAVYRRRHHWGAVVLEALTGPFKRGSAQCPIALTFDPEPMQASLGGTTAVAAGGRPITRGGDVADRDGLEAIDLAVAKRPDLILMDIQLPDISGLEVTRRLRGDERCRRIPIIAVTAFAMHGMSARPSTAVVTPTSQN